MFGLDPYPYPQSQALDEGNKRGILEAEQNKLDELAERGFIIGKDWSAWDAEHGGGAPKEGNPKTPLGGHATGDFHYHAHPTVGAFGHSHTDQTHAGMLHGGKDSTPAFGTHAEAVAHAQEHMGYSGTGSASDITRLTGSGKAAKVEIKKDWAAWDAERSAQGRSSSSLGGEHKTFEGRSAHQALKDAGFKHTHDSAMGREYQHPSGARATYTPAVDRGWTKAKADGGKWLGTHEMVTFGAKQGGLAGLSSIGAATHSVSDIGSAAKAAVDASNAQKSIRSGNGQFQTGQDYAAQHGDSAAAAKEHAGRFGARVKTNRITAAHSVFRFTGPRGAEAAAAFQQRMHEQGGRTAFADGKEVHVRHKAVEAEVRKDWAQWDEEHAGGGTTSRSADEVEKLVGQKSGAGEGMVHQVAAVYNKDGDPVTGRSAVGALREAGYKVHGTYDTGGDPGFHVSVPQSVHDAAVRDGLHYASAKGKDLAVGLG